MMEEKTDTEQEQTAILPNSPAGHYRALARDVLERLRVGVMVLSADFRMVWMNQTAGRYLGLKKEDVLGKDMRTLVREHLADVFEDPGGVSERVLAALRGHTYLQNFECRVVPGAHRRERWLTLWSQPILTGPYAGGRIEHFYDITARKTAQDRITHLNAVLLAVRDVNQLLITEKDPSRLVQKMTDSLVRTRGYYNAWIALFDSSGWAVSSAKAGFGEDFLPMAEQLAAGRLPSCAREALGKTGVLVVDDPPGKCHDCPLAHRHGDCGALISRLAHGEKVYGVIAVSAPRRFITEAEEQRLVKDVAEDIAFALHNMEMERERTTAERSLRSSEERYRRLFEETRDAIAITTRKGRFIDANQAFLDLFGYSREDLSRMTFKELYADPLLGRVFRREAEKKGFVKDFEVALMRKDGVKRDCLLTMSVRREDAGKIAGYQGIIRDISGYLELEARLRQAQKMEAIGTLAGGIAHDFNNILTAIMGYAELAGMEAPDHGHMRDDIGEVIKACYRARDLVSQILAFSRQSEEKKRPLYVSSIVKEVLKLLKASLPATIEIKSRIDEDAGPVIADPIQVHQVLMNLCTNARHAMREQGGVLEVSLSGTELGSGDPILEPEMAPGPYVRLTVRDTGCGMTPGIISRIFDPYFTTKEQGEGTGLGLAVSLGIVKSHGGTITVHSEQGKGSLFEVYLPLAPRTEESLLEKEEPPEAATVPGGHERILFVDDEAPLVEMVERILRNMGYRVETRTSSIEALELFRAHPERFDLVITDMTMPNMTGDRLAREIMKIRPGIPVILCTGFSERITREQARRMGIREFLLKPLVSRDLAAAIRKAMKQ
ncbi:MAG: hypothetical protein DRH56_07035 [Deltaproteobacteria bacterium]|nr:MAG: hypothetical protein DRH56_07035 [Deltaproteobacteria bacterium]